MAFTKGASLIQRIGEFDKKVSDRIHNLHLPAIIQAWVCFWGMLFNREGNLIVLAIVSAVLPLYQKTVQPYYGFYYGLQYFNLGMQCLILTKYMKKWLRRNRPPALTIYRVRNIRGKELDCSFPSGDTGQAGIFVFFMLFNMPDVVAQFPLQGLFLVLLLLNVAFARVFFQCHFIGDTIGGAFFAFLLVSANYSMNKLFMEYL